MLDLINSIINQLQATNSQLEKQSILSQYKDNTIIKKFFNYCYNPELMFYITSDRLKNNTNISEFHIFEDIFELCDLLISKKVSGNKAIALANGFINGNNSYEELLYNFFDKNLKIGMNIKQINKALNNIIPVFDVALANTYDKNKHEEYNLSNYFIQRKLNGARLITFIYYNNGTPNIIFKSRTGKEFKTLSKLKKELESIYLNSPYNGYDIVLDGETCIIDSDGKENWNRIVSEISKKNHTIYHPMYIIFDILLSSEFYGDVQSKNYKTRYDNIKRFIGMNKLEYIKIVFSMPYNEEHFKKMEEEYLKTEKWEGFIFRLNKPYKSGRSNDLIKYKLFKDGEFKVLDVTITSKPMLNENGLMEDTKCIGSLIIEYKGNRVDVGSGLTDKQRRDWFINPNEIIGKQIQVKYKEETINNNGTVSLQFPILTHVFETERNI